jgi:hypothetical protein
LGQDTPTTEIVIEVLIDDVGINNPPLGVRYTRLATLTWVDTPPAGISTYTFSVSEVGGANIEEVTFSDRALNATIFPIGSSLS